MTTATKARASIAIAPANGIIALKGRNKANREMAFVKIAPLSLVESLSRNECIANLRLALGASPSKAELSTARNEHIIGKVALKLDGKDNAKRLEQARDIVLHYATDTAKKIGKAQKGRRSPDQQRAYNAGKEQFSQLLAELGLGKAKTQGERNKAKATKTPHRNGKAQTPNHSELVEKPAKMDRALACDHIAKQAASLAAFANKYAKHLPQDFGQAVLAFKSAINTAMNAEQERIAKVEAEK